MNSINRNMKRIIFLLIIILISGLSGCSFLNGTTSSGDASGLAMNFEPERPPSGDLGENDPFRVAVNLKNTGDKSIYGELCVSDVFLYTGYGGIPEPECRMVSLGEPKEGIEPSEQTIFFPDELNDYTYTNLNQYFSQQDIIRATFNYEVDSSSATQLCVKGDIDTKLPAGISCLNRETISGSNIKNMKAPIIVTSIKKDFSSSSSSGDVPIKLEITLRKNTEGEITNIISYRVDYAGVTFDCGARSGQLYFEPDKNEKIIKCNSKINIGQDYIDELLEIKLSYSFKKGIDNQKNPIILKKEA